MATNQNGGRLIGEEKSASFAQMRNRMHDGHRLMLERARDGRRAHHATHGEVLRDRTIRTTLLRWGALDESGRITDIGLALLQPVPRPLGSGDIDDPRYQDDFIDHSDELIEPVLVNA